MKMLFNRIFKSLKKENHFPLPMSKAEFYLYKNYEFCDSYFKLSTNEDDCLPKEIIEKFDTVQKTCHYFRAVSGQICNGGVWQVFYNGYADYVKNCIAGFIEIGDTQMAEFLDTIYKHHTIQERYSKKGDFDIQSFLNDNGLDFEKLNNSLLDNAHNDKQSFKFYFEIIGVDIDEMETWFFNNYEKSVDNLVNFIKNNQKNYVVDEMGQPFVLDFTGEYVNNNHFKGVYNYRLAMKDGKPNGECIIYQRDSIDKPSYVALFEDGKLKELKYFYDTKIRYIEDYSNYPNFINRIEYDYYHYELKRLGVLKYCYNYLPIGYSPSHWIVGCKSVYLEDGTLYREFFYNDNHEKYKKIYYHKNGQKSAEYVYQENIDFESENRWYENGNVSRVCVFDKNGNYVHNIDYYENGNTRQIVKLAKYKPTTILDYWDENGVKLIDDGNGTLIEEYESGLKKITPYQNGKIHGIQKEFKGSLLYSECEYQDGKKHNNTFYYYENGKVQTHLIYDNDKEIVRRYYDENGEIKQEFNYS